MVRHLRNGDYFEEYKYSGIKKIKFLGIGDPFSNLANLPQTYLDGAVFLAKDKNHTIATLFD